MSIYWEWEIATLDENGDIIDLDHCPCSFITGYLPTNKRTVISLVRSVGNQRDGEIDRSYAEYANGVLPAKTDDGHIVPQRYRKMIAS